jgi:hypothetical protein
VATEAYYLPSGSNAGGLVEYSTMAGPVYPHHHQTLALPVDTTVELRSPGELAYGLGQQLTPPSIHPQSWTQEDIYDASKCMQISMKQT